ncbi:asparagine synthase-related protein [Haloarchaeobius sp. DFWS5]|uniref:asparagine synthase-related protein n=1 Tax=Haloarchaeobius sp. DFWS5 TaxID=3446114 RepID=UPI003EBDAD69
MVGVYGVLGDDPGAVEAMATNHGSTDAVTASYIDDVFGLVLTDFPTQGGAGSVELDDGTLLWVLGDVYGHETLDGYVPRPAGTDSTTFLSTRYDGDSAFGSGLNGGFLAILYDPDEGTVDLVTDRLATRPGYYTQTDGDGVAFATQLQRLPHHPGVEAAYDPAGFAEFLAFRHTFGTLTPLAGVTETQPGAVTTLSAADGSVEYESYWTPRRRPVSAGVEYFVDEFERRMNAIVAEWVQDELSYGVLLSGGSDSRLILAALDGHDDLTGFHIAGWPSRETRVARRVAHTAGADFEFLRRDSGYYQRLFQSNGPLSNFDGWFVQGYVTDFADQLSEVDVLISGLYADTLFKGRTMPTRSVTAGPFGPIGTPIHEPITDVVSFRDQLSADVPAYVEDLPDVDSLLRQRIRWDDDTVVHHGVEYPSVDELVVCSPFYPLSNDTELIFSNSLMQIRPYRSPFLDNRMLDLHLQLPTDVALRENIIDRALSRLSPELGSIPHAGTRVPPNQHRLVSYAGRLGTELLDKYVSPPTTPKPHQTNGPWPDRGTLLRTTDFAEDTVEAGNALLDGHPHIDEGRTKATLRSHFDGADETGPILSLLTVLSMPVTRDVVASAGSDRRQTSSVPTFDHPSEEC